MGRMLRSAAVAVLAVALSSTAAQAQTFVSDVETLLSLGRIIEQQTLAENYLTRSVTYETPEPPRVESIGTSLSLALSYEIGKSTPIRKPDFTVAIDAPVDRERQVFLSMYATQGLLQTLDVMTTTTALAAGHREANPLFKNGSLSTMVIAKAAAVGVNIWAVERLRKTNPKAAMWLMKVSNAMMSAVVVNNASVLAK
jgi:hypothetical protein